MPGRASLVLWPALAAAALAVAGRASAQAPAARPAGVTDSAIARGRAVFDGPANCTSCHGRRGEGSPRAPALNDAKWIKGSGTYAEILERVVHGMPRRESSTGQPMPMRGWSPVSDDDVRAVAAYVWWLSHQPGPAP